MKKCRAKSQRPTVAARKARSLESVVGVPRKSAAWYDDQLSRCARAASQADLLGLESRGLWKLYRRIKSNKARWAKRHPNIKVSEPGT